MKPSPEQERGLRAFSALLAQKAVPAGFVAASDAERIWERHILDSLRAAEGITDRDRLSYDLGSGAGLPGIPLAVVHPACRFVLCESQRRRVAFLELAVERLGLDNVDVVAGRAEELASGADVVTARAFAPLERSWEVARPLLSEGGRLVYFAGGSLDDPEAEARRVAGDAADVSLIDRLASSPPLVMMTRT